MTRTRRQDRNQMEEEDYYQDDDNGLEEEGVDGGNSPVVEDKITTVVRESYKQQILTIKISVSKTVKQNK